MFFIVIIFVLKKNSPFLNPSISPLFRYLQSIKDCPAEAVNALQSSDIRFVFIFDSYDQLAGGGFPNVYVENAISEWGLQSKAIVVCSGEYMHGHDYLNLLNPSGASSHAAVTNTITSAGLSPYLQTQTAECHVAALTKPQIEQYFRNLQAASGASATTQIPVSDYMAFLEDQPSVAARVTTPFMQQLFMSAFPVLRRTERPANTYIYRSQLYDAFMLNWYETQEKRLTETVTLPQMSLRNTFAAFAMALGYGMVRESKSEISCKGCSWTRNRHAVTADAHAWHRWYLRNDIRAAEARLLCPLRHVNGLVYTFSNQSFAEYFAAEQLLQSLQMDDDQTALDWGARCLSRPPRADAVVEFLAERLAMLHGHEGHEYEQMRERLYKLVAKSKKSETAVLGSEQLVQSALNAASNAITILNAASVPLTLKWRHDPGFFRDIQIPYADLSLAELSGVDLSNSDLAHCTLFGAKLACTDLRGCNLVDIDLQETPVLSFAAAVTCVAVSSDGLQLAVGSKDGPLLLLRRVGLEWVTGPALLGHDGSVHSLAFSPAADLLVSGGADHTVRLWSTAEGEQIRLFVGHESYVRAVAFSCDGQRVASGGGDKTVRVWSITADTAQFVLRGHDSYVETLAFCPTNSAVLASGGGDKTVRLWDLAPRASQQYVQYQQELAKQPQSPTSKPFVSTSTLQPPSSPSSSAAAATSSSSSSSAYASAAAAAASSSLFSTPYASATASLSSASASVPASATLSSAATTTTTTTSSLSVPAHPTPSGNMPMTPGKRAAAAAAAAAAAEAKANMPTCKVLFTHRSVVNAVEFSPDGKMLVSGSNDYSIKLFHVVALAATATLADTAFACDSAVLSLSFSPDGRQVAAAVGDETVRLWGINGKAGPIFRGHEGNATSVSFTPDGMGVISGGCDDKTVRIWDIHDPVTQRIKGHENFVNAVAFARDGQLIASVSTDLTLRVWHPDGSPGAVVQAHDQSVSCVAFAHNCRTVVTGSWDHTVRMWDAQDGSLVQMIQQDNVINCVAFSSDGFHFATGCEDKTARVWSYNGLPGAVMRGHERGVTCVAFTPDNRHIVTGSSDGTVRMWKCVDGSELVLFHEHDMAVTCVAVSPNGKQVVSGSADRSVRVYMIDGTPSTVFTGHENTVTGVAFAPNGRRLASCSLDGTIRIWNPINKQGVVVRGHTSFVTGVAFGPDSDLLASSSGDTTVRVWGPLDPEDLDSVWVQVLSFPRVPALVTDGCNLQGADYPSHYHTLLQKP